MERTLVKLNDHDLKESGITFSAQTFYKWRAANRHPQLFAEEKQHISVIKEQWDELIKKGIVKNRGETTTYDLALKVGKALGKTDREIWDKIHQVEERHGIWKDGNYLDEDYEKLTVKLSQNTLSALLYWLMEREKHATIKSLAAREKTKVHVLRDILYRPHRRLVKKTQRYRDLKRIAEKYNIRWEEI